MRMRRGITMRMRRGIITVSVSKAPNLSVHRAQVTHQSPPDPPVHAEVAVGCLDTALTALDLGKDVHSCGMRV